MLCRMKQQEGFKNHVFQDDLSTLDGDMLNEPHGCFTLFPLPPSAGRDAVGSSTRQHVTKPHVLLNGGENEGNRLIVAILYKVPDMERINRRSGWAVSCESARYLDQAFLLVVLLRWLSVEEWDEGPRTAVSLLITEDVITQESHHHEWSCAQAAIAH